MVSRDLPGPFGTAKLSFVLILSYIADWIIIIGAAAVAGGLSFVTPNKRPFALTNPEISFPHVLNEKISSTTLYLVGLVAPAVLIVVVCLLLVPGPTVSKSTPTALIWKRKLWEWHTGWLGLALALASATLITQGMKNLFGKPRPDMLSRCDPDLANRAQHVVGGFARVSSEFLLYSASICRNQDASVLDDGFRSYPSGHASFSAAGLIYLSLFIASKLAIAIPFLPATGGGSGARADRNVAFPSRIPRDEDKTALETTGHGPALVSARNEAASPPVYLLVFAVVPFFASVYISSTRYSDFRHHGFDILFGYLIGLITAVFAFRYYHMPIRQGAGWSWGPRSSERSFWAGVGVGSYAGGRKHPAPQHEGSGDVENVNGHEAVVGNGSGSAPARNGY